MGIKLLLDVAPETGAIGLALGVGFFLVFAAVAYVAFRVLRRTMKMAFRLAIVGVILLVAILGSVTILWLGSSKPSPRPPRPTPTRSR
ncbi:MAG TPA: hypothetical protein VEV84_10100 [Pyrinomonadaceae bacterium]|jgi:hypothetical protein|nr:hypothetical protein [Pyrinomonadaceae bacterium]